MDQQFNEPSIREYFSLLYRWRFVVLAVAIVTTGTVAVVAYLTPQVFTADTALIVRFGREFIYRSEVAGHESSKTFSLDEMVNSEVEILSSRDLARQVVEEMTVETLYPDIVGAEEDEATVIALAAARFQGEVSVTPVLESSIIRITFTHPVAQVAAEALNILVDKFKDKHLEVFGGSKSDFLEVQLEKYKTKLDDAESALQSFKRKNGIYRITEQEEAILSLQLQLRTELRNTQFRVTEREHQLKAAEAGVNMPLNASPYRAISTQRETLVSRRNDLNTLLEEAVFRIAELSQSYARFTNREGKSDLSIALDSRTSRARSLEEALIRLLDLRIKEKDLLRTHRKESRELVTVRSEIELVRKFLKARGKLVEKTLKNAVSGELRSLRSRRAALVEQIAKIDSDIETLDSRQRALHIETINTALAALKSNHSALASQLAELDKELPDLDSKGLKLRQLERDVAVSDQSYQTFLAKYEEAEIAGELDERKIVNLRVIEKATPPVTSSGLSRRIKIVVGAVVGLVAGVAVAFLLEMFAR